VLGEIVCAPASVAAGAAVATGITLGGGAVGNELGEALCPEEDGCPPCKTVSGKVVAVGTIGYRPLDTPDRPQHGIDGSHYNLLKANQIPKGNPVGECDCFWQPIGAVSPTDLPAGAIPAEPFDNNR
jgi:hypothetical protein